jgi:hypothetical protein
MEINTKNNRLEYLSNRYDSIPKTGMKEIFTKYKH